MYLHGINLGPPKERGVQTLRNDHVYDGVAVASKKYKE